MRQHLFFPPHPFPLLLLPHTHTGEIPEGYIDVILPGNREKKILHPAYPGSIYHATKCLDALLFQFYAKNDLLRLTDLHQGIVWGTNTPLTAKAPELCNRFDYDGEYGTVLNRFLMQAACDIPLTVYGTGGQTRAFIHITDTCRCIELAVSNPPSAGQPVEILNQVAETARVRDVAELVAKISGAEVQRVANPRQEDAENELDVANNKFKLLGLDPILLDSSEGLFKGTQRTHARTHAREKRDAQARAPPTPPIACMLFYLLIPHTTPLSLSLSLSACVALAIFAEVTEIAQKYSGRCDRSKVISKSYWNKARAVAAGTSEAAGATAAAK